MDGAGHSAGSAGLRVEAWQRLGVGQVRGEFERSAGAPGGPAHGCQPALAGSTLLAKLESGAARRGRGLADMP